MLVTSYPPLESQNTLKHMPLQLQAMHDSCLLRGRVATYWLTWFSFEACITSYAASVTIEHLRRIDIEDKTVPVPSVRPYSL